jgi:ribosome-associated protein
MHDEFDPLDEAPSKTRLKRDALALQELGAALVEAPETDWFALQLPDTLIAALHEARHIRSRSAHKRQLQYIGKLMREIDAQPIRDYFERQRLETRRLAQAHHELEHWRDRMIEEGDSAVEDWLDSHSAGDRQHLRQLVRQARKECTQEKTRASRALFRYLRDQE